MVTGENLAPKVEPVIVRVAVLIVNGTKGCDAEGDPVIVRSWVFITRPREGGTLFLVGGTNVKFAATVMNSPVIPLAAGKVDLDISCAWHSRYNDIMIAAARITVQGLIFPSLSPN